MQTYITVHNVFLLLCICIYNIITVCYLSQRESSSDPNVLTGTPCCPGVVEGTVRVVTSIDQTEVCV